MNLKLSPEVYKTSLLIQPHTMYYPFYLFESCDLSSQLPQPNQSRQELLQIKLTYPVLKAPLLSISTSFYLYKFIYIHQINLNIIVAIICNLKFYRISSFFQSLQPIFLGKVRAYRRRFYKVLYPNEQKKTFLAN